MIVQPAQMTDRVRRRGPGLGTGSSSEEDERPRRIQRIIDQHREDAVYEEAFFARDRRGHLTTERPRRMRSMRGDTDNEAGSVNSDSDVSSVDLLAEVRADMRRVNEERMGFSDDDGITPGERARMARRLVAMRSQVSGEYNYASGSSTSESELSDY